MTRFFLVILATVLSFCAASLGDSGSDAQITVTDARHDDHGSGEIRYPSDSLFTAGCFDLIHLGIKKSGDTFEFKVTFRTPIQPPPDIRISEAISLKERCREGFYAANVDIYLRVKDELRPGVTWLLPGRKAELAAGYRWNRAILLTPQPEAARSRLKTQMKNGILKAGREQSDGIAKTKKEAQLEANQFITDSCWFAGNVTVTGKIISFAVPAEWLGDADFQKWNVLVIVTGAAFMDDYDLAGFLSGDGPDGNIFVRGITSIGSKLEFGGASGSPGESNIIDITVPEGMSQEKILNRYTDDSYCRLPMISLQQ